jgi:hypothetical protein
MRTDVTSCFTTIVPSFPTAASRLARNDLTWAKTRSPSRLEPPQGGTTFLADPAVQTRRDHRQSVCQRRTNRRCGCHAQEPPSPSAWVEGACVWKDDRTKEDDCLERSGYGGGGHGIKMRRRSCEFTTKAQNIRHRLLLGDLSGLDRQISPIPSKITGEYLFIESRVKTPVGTVLPRLEQWPMPIDLCVLHPTSRSK